jgi:DNA-directed RNA polymerase subunit RPC12/RpoP
MTQYKTQTNTRIVCPYCGYYLDKSEYPPLWIIKTQSVKCPICKYTMSIKAKIVYTATTEVQE